MAVFFDHEKLRVYQEAIAFVAWWEEINSRCTCPPAVKDQMDRASTSVPLNIAEGNGKYSARERSRYFQIDSSSTLECAACLDVLVARRRLTTQDVQPGKRHLHAIVSMLVGLIASASDRAAEEAEIYSFCEDGVPEPQLNESE
jgi:four helix bundle protein